MKGKHIELPKETYVEVNDIIEKYDHSPITELQSVVEKIMIERTKKVDSAVLGEIQQIAVENGLETKIILNERNVADALRNYQDGYAHIKAEVAREIFEEIEEAMKHWESIWKSDHYGSGGGAYGYLETDVDSTIYDIKKKYTEARNE